MTDTRPWEAQTVQQMRDYAAAAGIDLSHLPSKAAKRELYAAINRALADRAVAAVDEVAPPGVDAETGEVDVALTDHDKAAYYAATGRLPDDDAETDEAMRHWHAPDEDDVDVLDAARDRTTGSSLLPTKAQWTQIDVMGDTLSEGRMVKAKQLGTPADVKLILLAARDLGIPPTMAIQQIHVIDGKPSLSAQLMVALVRNAGYSIIPTAMTAERAVAKGTRLDEVVEFEFTMAEAETAKLSGKDNWKHYPKAMLWSRAVSGLCRVLFPDVLAGLTYTPEELGGEEWGDDAPVQVASTASIDDDPPLDELARAQVLAQITARPDYIVDALKLDWKQMTEGRHLRTLDRLRQSDLPALNALFGRHPIPEFGERPDDSDPGEVETPDDDARTYATGQTEQTVTSPLLNDPEDAVTICPSCGIDLEVDNPGCLEHPFA